MRLYLSATILTLAWFGVSNALASLGAWAALGSIRRAAAAGRAPSATLLFAVRMAPIALATLFACGVFLPAHWADESREGTEYFGVLLYALAGLSLLIVWRSMVRTLRALRAFRALRHSWPRPVSGAAPVIDEDAMPGMTLAGVFRTTVLVGRPVREALSGDELEVAFAHEFAHQRSHDNIKRFAMFASPDFFSLTPAARELERMWNAAVECDADAVAVNGDAVRAANLASALVKVARLAGASTHVPASPLWSTFYQPSLLEVRVRRLVAGASVPPRSSLLSTVLPVLLTVAVASAWMTGVPRAVHEMTELLVSLLP